MVKHIFTAITLTILLFANGGKTTPKIVKNHTILKGFNVNWSFLPPINSKMIDAIISLKPQILRYPGGTISKTWDWKSGTSSKGRRRTPHKLKDLSAVAKATGADVIFVLNIMTSNLINQIALLKKAKSMGIAIKYIEIGNEVYLSREKFKDNVKKFPTGKEYGKFANRWAKKIKKIFPRVKIGITMFSRTNSKKDRMKNWNNLVIKNIEDKNYDALIYHIYLKFPKNSKLNNNIVDNIVTKRVDDFKKAKIYDKTKEIWITEYGVLANTLEKTITSTKKLADFLESIADISMVHVLYTKIRRHAKSKWRYFSMLAKPKADALTKLGKVFKDRYNKQ